MNPQEAIKTLTSALEKCAAPDSELAHPGCPADLQKIMANAFRLGRLESAARYALGHLGVEVRS